MDKYLTTIRSTVCDITDTYFEAQLYRYPEEQSAFEFPQRKTLSEKLSRIIVVSKGKELVNRTLSNSEVERLFSSIEQIRFKLDKDERLQVIQHPEIAYHLKIKSINFSLTYKWTSNGIEGNRKLEQGLMSVVETLESVLENDSFALDIQALE